ncbi:hypothetical protein BJ508DRAFT_378486 [Ascobolus immersus RN42]|uniref:Uncharacterized protein n=1 Tax=Ascobolus immersus RN42 TaxID=1160509 RepID=A0A3N4HW21_ASCIM|nr:hypothetical protein BJ508DRAFT_378486 [Ascobolus immersus RN42]
MSLLSITESITASSARAFPITGSSSNVAKAPGFVCTGNFDTVQPLGQELPSCRAGSAYDSVFKGARDRCYEVKKEDARAAGWNQWPHGRNFNKGNCEEHCSNLYDNTFITNLNKCWKAECEDHDSAGNRAFLEYIRDADIKGICEPLGIKEKEPSADSEKWMQCTLLPDDFHYDLQKISPNKAIMPQCGEMVSYYPLAQAQEKCMNLTIPSDEERKLNGWYPRGLGKEQCADLCEMVYNGTALDLIWKCFDGRCTDARDGKYEALNDYYLEGVTKDLTVKHLCQHHQVGIMGAARPSPSKCWKYASSTSTEAVEISCDEAEAILTGKQEKEEAPVDGEKTTEDKEPGKSDADGLGGKKASVILAVVFGAVIAANGALMFNIVVTGT